MIAVTYLPLFVTLLFRGMPGIWKSRHRLVLCWLVLMQALFPGRKTLEELTRWTPASITAWRFRRLLKASDWHVHRLVAWWVQEAFNTLQPPSNGVISRVGDGSDKPKRGPKNPWAQTGRKNEHHPWFFGIRFALLIANWDQLSLSRLNHWLPRGQAHPEIMQGTADFHHDIPHTILPQTDPVFDDAAALDTPVDMLDTQPSVVQRLVGRLLLPRQLLAVWFLGRHEDRDLRERERQEAQILQQPAASR